MGLLDKVKTSIAEALAPARADENRELQYLRQIYENRDGGIRRNQWYRILNPSGDNVGFAFSCICGTEYQLLHVTDWLGRQHACGSCKTSFDLLKACGITSEIPAAQWAQHFAKLPVRPRLSGGKRTPPFADTWADNTGDVQWAGGKPHIPDGWV
jgi:hypothetical protein